MKIKRILLLRSQDIITDSRVQRYEDWYKDNQIPFRILGWDREAKGIKRDHTDYCTIQAGYNLGAGGIKYRIKWNVYLMRYLFKKRKSYDVIHACDFDTVIPALIMRVLGKKVIFDIFDWFSDEVQTGKKPIDLTINTLEKLAVKLANLTILCEEERLEQIGCHPTNYMVVPNIPTIPRFEQDKDFSIEKRVKIAYVGGFYPDRGLEQLLDTIVKFPEIELHIAGFGNESLVQKTREVSTCYTNVKYYGKVNYKEAIGIMTKCHVMYGMYYRRNKNNIFAAPNKFYEAIFLEKPLITTKGTLVGQKVECYNVGFVIDEGTSELARLLQQITLEMINDRIDHIRQVQPMFTSRWQDTMEQYGQWIQKLSFTID